MIKLSLVWNPLSTQNAYWQNWKIRYIHPNARLLKKSYINQINLQLVTMYDYKKLYDIKLPIETPVSIVMQIFFWDKRKRDVDNYSKFVLDSLTWIILTDDSQIYKITVEKFYDKAFPRVDLVIDDYICKNI